MKLTSAMIAVAVSGCFLLTVAAAGPAEVVGGGPMKAMLVVQNHVSEN